MNSIVHKMKVHEQSRRNSEMSLALITHSASKQSSANSRGNVEQSMAITIRAKRCNEDSESRTSKKSPLIISRAKQSDDHVATKSPESLPAVCLTVYNSNQSDGDLGRDIVENRSIIVHKERSDEDVQTKVPIRLSSDTADLDQHNAKGVSAWSATAACRARQFKESLKENDVENLSNPALRQLRQEIDELKRLNRGLERMNSDSIADWKENLGRVEWDRKSLKKRDLVLADTYGTSSTADIRASNSAEIKHRCEQLSREVEGLKGCNEAYRTTKELLDDENTRLRVQNRDIKQALIRSTRNTQATDLLDAEQWPDSIDVAGTDAETIRLGMDAWRRRISIGLSVWKELAGTLKDSDTERLHPETVPQSLGAYPLQWITNAAETDSSLESVFPPPSPPSSTSSSLPSSWDNSSEDTSQAIDKVDDNGGFSPTSPISSSSSCDVDVEDMLPVQPSSSDVEHMFDSGSNDGHDCDGCRRITALARSKRSHALRRMSLQSERGEEDALVVMSRRLACISHLFQTPTRTFALLTPDVSPGDTHNTPDTYFSSKESDDLTAVDYRPSFRGRSDSTRKLTEPRPKSITRVNTVRATVEFQPPRPTSIDNNLFPRSTSLDLRESWSSTQGLTEPRPERVLSRDLLPVNSARSLLGREPEGLSERNDSVWSGRSCETAVGSQSSEDMALLQDVPPLDAVRVGMCKPVEACSVLLPKQRSMELEKLAMMDSVGMELLRLPSINMIA